MTNDQLDRIRQRWQGKHWHYEESFQSSGMTAILVTGADLRIAVQRPTTAQQALLRHIAHAPRDVQVLLVEVEAQRESAAFQTDRLGEVDAERLRLLDELENARAAFEALQRVSAGRRTDHLHMPAEGDPLCADCAAIAAYQARHASERGEV